MLNSNLLRAAMAERGFSQAQLAQAIGISENSMSRKLNGKREFRLSEVVAITEVLGLKEPQLIFLPRSSQICNYVQDYARPRMGTHGDADKEG